MLTRSSEIPAAAWAAPDTYRTSVGGAGETPDRFSERIYVGELVAIRSDGPDGEWVASSVHGFRGDPFEIVPELDDVRFIDASDPGFYALQGNCEMEVSGRGGPARTGHAPTFLVQETHTLVIDERTHLVVEMTSAWPTGDSPVALRSRSPTADER
jgi:hypothetical protein